MTPKSLIKKYVPGVQRVHYQMRVIKKSLKYSSKNYRLVKTDRYKMYKVYSSQSFLRRTLGNADPHLQEAKVKNLQVAIPEFNNVVIGPGQIFSFWKILGKPTRGRGFVEGMYLSEGQVTTGIGGGICQLANMIHWLFMHTSLQSKEHWHHDYDVFPDSGRTIPFGSGAGVLYNIFDLQYYNPTEETFTLSLQLTDRFLKGSVYSSKTQTHKHHIVEEDHQFYFYSGQVFRQNKLFKIIIDKRTGGTAQKILVKHNNSKVLYQPDPKVIIYP